MELNLPAYEFRIIDSGQGKKIFDETRKKWLLLTPEEYVRQSVIKFLVTELSYPASAFAIEKKLDYNGRPKRFDLLVYNKGHLPAFLVECKAPTVEITAKVLQQAAMYNFKLKVPYLLLTNGLNHICYHIDYELNKLYQLQTMPTYAQLV